MNMLRMRVSRWFSRRVAALLFTILGGVATQAATNYWDTSTASGLQSGNGTWGTDSYWSPDTNGTTLQAWTANNDAYFQTGGANAVGIASGGVSVHLVTQTTGGTATTVNGPGILALQNASGAGIMNSGNQLLTINAPISVGFNGTIVDANTADITIGGNITIGNKVFRKQGNGTLTLSGTNTGTSFFQVEAGTLVMTTINAQPTTLTFVQIGSGNANATLIYNLSGSTSATVGNQFQIGNNGGGTGGGAIKNNSSDSGACLIFSNATFSAFSGTSSGNRTLTLGGSNTGNNEIKGVIQDNIAGTTIGVIKSDAGKWILSATNLYSGTTVLSNGTLAVAGSGALSTNLVTLAGGGLAGASGGGMLSNVINMVSNANYDTSAGDLVIAGVITNRGALTKTGAGTLTLSATNTYAGATTVSNGTLKIQGVVTGAVTVVAGGTLGGSGTVAGTVTNYATLTAAATNSIGSLTVTNLAMMENSHYVWNYDAGSQDVIHVTGNLSLSSAATVTVSQVSAATLPKTCDLMTFGTGPADGNLNWTVTGAGVPSNTKVMVRDHKVQLVVPFAGTLVEIY